MPIDYEKRDGVAYITLNNPAKANILDKETSDEISAAWIDLWEDRDIRCAILTGAGERHFCGGQIKRRNNQKLAQNASALCRQRPLHEDT